jgi:hypothetical protein
MTTVPLATTDPDEDILWAMEQILEPLTREQIATLPDRAIERSVKDREDNAQQTRLEAITIRHYLRVRRQRVRP